MGYYKSAEPNKGRKGHFLSGFGGVLAGVVLAGTILPGMSDSDGVFDTANAPVETVSGLESVSKVVTTDVTETVDATSAAVVGVTNMRTVSQNPFMQSSEAEPQEAGVGSGVIYKKEGDYAYIVTNNHVVEGAEDVVVTMADGTELPAEVLGADVWTDLAVLKVEGKAIDTVANFGDSSVLKAGEPVIAIGNPLGLQFSGSVTTGVISGTERSVPVDIDGDGAVDWQAEVLQTDAAINPGNSGGALINSEGQVIGINSMKIAQASVEGIGLAIPINSAVPIIEDLEKKGEVERPSLGVTIMDLGRVPAQYREAQLGLPAEVEGGVVVDSVAPGSGAAEGGLESGDVIVKMGDEAIESVLQLRQYLYNEVEIGDTISITVYRDGEQQTLQVTLAESL